MVRTVKNGSGEAQGNTGRLAAFGLALMPAAMLMLLMTRKVWDVDVFWQLKLGELILANGGPIAREPFSASHLSDPLPAVAWLGQAAMAGVRLLGGWDALRLFDALCWLGGFWAAAWAARRQGAGALGLILGMGLALIAALPAASVRPQSLAALCFGLLLALPRTRLSLSAKVLAGAVLLTFWQNLHPSVSVAALALAAGAGGGWLARWRGRETSMPVAETLLAAFAALAVFLTPDGISVMAVSLRNAEASRAMAVSEWLPLWAPVNRTLAVPVLVVAALAARFAMRGWKQVDPRDAAMALALLLLTVTAYRFVLFWAIALVPLVASSFARPDRGPLPVPRWAAPLAVGVASLAALAVLPTRFHETVPVEAVARLRDQTAAGGVRGTIYADFGFGGPIIDVGYPDWNVAYDGRYYRYTPAEWAFNAGVESGRIPLSEVERRFHPAAFVLSQRRNRPLIEALKGDPRWRMLAEEGAVSVFVPCAVSPCRASPESVPR
jgi:hypothetical protein